MKKCMWCGTYTDLRIGETVICPKCIDVLEAQRIRQSAVISGIEVPQDEPRSLQNTGNTH